MQAPTASPNIVIEITVAENHLKSQVNIKCPSIVDIKVKHKIYIQVSKEYSKKLTLIIKERKTKNINESIKNELNKPIKKQ